MNTDEKLLAQMQSALQKQFGKGHVDNEKAEKLTRFASLLLQWNQKMNLVGNVTPEIFVLKHIVDSLVVAPWLEQNLHNDASDVPRCLDFGTGAGLPGVPLAIMLPDWHFDLLDARQKRIEFIRFASGQAGLQNVSLFAQRAENHKPLLKYDKIVTRAVSSLAQVVKLTRHCLAEKGQWLIMKGVYPEDECREIDAMSLQYKVELLEIEGMAEQRHLVIIENNG